jgi:NADH pyrophosphatase NudC (nudix superfamily)
MKPPIDHFIFCPRCGRPRVGGGRATVLHCAACDFLHHFNPAIAAGVFLFIRRAPDPAVGKLALPGGFVDFGETAEEALKREILEEVNPDFARASSRSEAAAKAAPLP